MPVQSLQPQVYNTQRTTLNSTDTHTSIQAFTQICMSPPRVAVYLKVNKSDYSTLSLNGVTRMIAGREPQFTDLDQWVRDLAHFNQLIKIGTFAKFRMWKAFATWRKNVRSRYPLKINHRRNLELLFVGVLISGDFKSARSRWRKTCLSSTHNCRWHCWRSELTVSQTTRVN